MSDTIVPFGLKPVNIPKGLKPVQAPTKPLSLPESITTADPEVYDRIKSSQELGKMLRMDPAFINKNYIQVTERLYGTPQKPTNVLKGIWNSGTTGYYSTLEGMLWAKKALGDTSPELDKQIAEVHALIPPPEEQKKNLPRRMLESASNFIGQQYLGMESGAQRGLALGGGAAIATAIAGQLGPQIAAPEELVTVPSAFLAMFGVGMASGATETIGYAEMGHAYKEYIEMGVSEDIAKRAAYTVGVFNTAIEMSQMITFTKTIPGVSQPLKKAMKEATRKALVDGSIKNILLKFAGRQAKFVAEETGQEVVQEIVTMLGGEISRRMENNRNWNDLEPATREEVISRLTDTAIQSALGFTLMGLPGNVSATADQYYKGVQAKRAIEAIEGAETSIRYKEGGLPDIQVNKKEQAGRPPIEQAVETLKKTFEDKSHREIAEIVKEAYGPQSEEYRKTRDILKAEVKEAFKLNPEEDLDAFIRDFRIYLSGAQKDLAYGKNRRGVNLYGLSKLWTSAANLKKKSMSESHRARLIKEMQNRPEKFEEIWAAIAGDEDAVWALQEDVEEEIELSPRERYEQEFRKSFTDFTEEQTAASMALFDSMAQAQGLSPDELAEGYMRGFTTTMPTESTAQDLFPQASGFHGSPHAFDQFSTDFMSTGEGGQAFGWGIYLSEDTDIAQGYAEKLGKEPGKRNIYSTTLFKGKTEGKDYNWLDWSKPAGEAVVNQVSAGLKKEIDGRSGAEAETFAGAIANLQAVMKEKGDSLEGKDVYLSLKQSLKSAKNASKFLSKYGIDGIRYPSGTLTGIKDSDINNYVVFDEKNIDIEEHTRYQKETQANQTYIKAAVQFDEAGKALIYASKQADFSSYVHEMAHIYDRHFLQGKERATVEKWLGVKQGQWTKEHREKFANGFEQYLQENKAPTKELASVFEKMKEWLADIYDRFQRMRMPRNVRKIYDSMLYSDPKRVSNQLFEAFEKKKNIWLGNKDVDIHKAKTEASRLQRELREAVGPKNDVKEFDRAIHIYIDLKNNPEHSEQFYNKLTDEQRRLVGVAMNLPENVKAIADKISQSYKKTGLEALDAEIIQNVHENYVSRTWDLKGKPADEVLRKFGTKTRHAKPRVFGTILEGWAAGYELKTEGAIENLRNLKTEITKVINDKTFLNTLMKTTDLAGNPVATTKDLKGYKEIKHPNFKVWRYAGNVEEGEAQGRNFFITENGTVMERKSVYAPEKVADFLNNVMGTSALYDIPGVKAITRFNAELKSTVLQGTLFHHQAYLRSYWLPGGLKHLDEMNPFQAAKAGLEAIRNDDPTIIHLVRHGLTLGVRQEWEQYVLEDRSTFGRLMDQMEITKNIKDKILNLREAGNRVLFETWGAGLKAKQALITYREHIEKNPDLDPDIAAEHVANLINDDFGGLNLARMGRNPTLQHIFRLLCLAPDWTESNIRSMAKAFKGGEEGQLYRKFWAGILLKGAAATVFGNFLLAGGDPEEWIKRYKMAWDAGEDDLLHIDVKKFTSLDITPIYEALGGKSGRRKYFPLIGHFVDPIKFILEPIKSGKHKSSFLIGLLYDAISGKDWAGRSYTTVGELLQTGETVKWDWGKGILSYDQFPSFILNHAIRFTPVPIQNIITWSLGEIEAFDAIASGLGASISSTWESKTNRKGTDNLF